MTREEGPISTAAGLAADVVEKAQRGDAASLDLFARLCYQRAYRWALSYTGEPDDAEDIAQQVSIRACEKLHTFRFAAQITTWLYRLTRRTLANAYRTRGRRQTLLQERLPALPRHVAPATELTLLAIFVKEQLGTLPARQREVFDLVDLQGYAAADVAVMLHLEEATVRVHLLRARRTVRARVLQERPYSYQEAANEL